MSNSLTSNNPSSYLGVRATTPPQMIVMQRAPTANDFIGYQLGTQWFAWDKDTPANSVQYVLASVANSTAVWIPLHGEGDQPIVDNHAVAIGKGVPGLNSADVIATQGAPLICNGLAADPSFGVASVSGGGTGLNTCATYAVYCGGTAATGPLQQVAGLGNAGQVLTSNGNGVLPSWQAVGGVGSIIVTKYETPGDTGNHTLNANCTMVEIFAFGGGGGGGGGQSDAVSGLPGGGAGGCPGGYLYYKTFAEAFGGGGSLVPYTVGAGGAGGTSGNYGEYGTSSIFGSISTPKSTQQNADGGSLIKTNDTFPSMVSNGSLIDFTIGTIATPTPDYRYSPFYSYSGIDSYNPCLAGKGGGGLSFPPGVGPVLGGSVYSFDGTTLLVAGGVSAPGEAGKDGGDGGFIGGMLVAGAGGSGAAVAMGAGGKGGFPAGGGGGGASDTGNNPPGGTGGQGGGGMIVVVEYLA